ncbi:MAG: hypothetical protein CMF46_02785 [Legionellales bacterium]|nr:hypothetical protein [Legionellales bacterium]
MRKKTNCLLFSIIILFTFSCNNTITEDNDASNNELTNVNSNESLTSQLRQIHSAPSTSARTSMFDSQKSNDECFEFIYPISFVLPDGSEITINSDEDWDKIDLWYEENNDAEVGPEIKYPFAISLDGSIFEVNNDIDFLELIYLIINFCGDYEEDYEEECFEFVYPIAFILPDGSEITINSDEDWDKIDLWYEENKDSEEEPEIVYPFDVIVEDEIITVESEDGLDRLKEVCD